MKITGRWLGVAVVITVVTLGPANWTEAHARLIRTDPSPGSVLSSSPRVVRLWFRIGGTEELHPRGSAVSVWDGRGRRVDDGKGGVDLNDLDRRSMIVRLRPIGPGTYTVKWKAVSTPDGSVTKGEFRFRVAAR
ncbi:MAG: copper resistance CopC family protein [bacterium]